MQKRRLQRADVVDGSVDYSSEIPSSPTLARDDYALQAEMVSHSVQRIVVSGVIALAAIIVFMMAILAIIGEADLIKVYGIWVLLGLLVLGALVASVHIILNAIGNHQLRSAETGVLRAQAYQMRRVLPMSDDQGNAIINDPNTHTVNVYQLQLRQFNMLSSFHNAPKYTGVPQQEPQALLTAGNMQRLTIEDAARHIKNELESCLGSSLLNNGTPITVGWEDSHIKVIGASRQGKSCLAAIIMREGELTHSPARLQFAMLDYEYKTSRLFEHSSHLAKLDSSGRRVPLHAKSLDEVPAALHLLAREMARRDRLNAWEVEDLPHVLIYIEEFLNLKKQLRAHMPKQYEQFLTDLHALATGGLKLRMHLMVCAQVDYSDDDLKEIMAQFYGLNISFGVKPTAAQAAGFICLDLIAQNYQNKQQGQFVMESSSGNDLGLAVDFDIKAKLRAFSSRNESRNEVEMGDVGQFRNGETVIIEEPRKSRETGSKWDRNESRNGIETASQVSLEQKLREVMGFLDDNPGATSTDILKTVWNVKPGKNAAYEQAKREYAQVQALHQQYARRGMQQG